MRTLACIGSKIVRRPGTGDFTVLAMSGTAQALTRSQPGQRELDLQVEGKLGVRVTFSVTGKISYTAVQGPHSILWKEPAAQVAPLTAKVHAYNKGRCTGSAKLRKISMGQFWTGYSCSFNPSLSASAPWGVGIGGWPSCWVIASEPDSAATRTGRARYSTSSIPALGSRRRPHGLPPRPTTLLWRVS